jgi:hypothetical protein
MGSGADPLSGSGQALYFSNSFVVTSSGSDNTFVLGQGNQSSSTGSTNPTEYGLINSSNGAFYVGNTPRSFWTTNYGYQWNPLLSDWAPYEYKGECYQGSYVTGLSKFPSGANQAHAVQCGPAGKTLSAPSQCHAVGFHGVDNRVPSLTVDRKFFAGMAPKFRGGQMV